MDRQILQQLQKQLHAEYDRILKELTAIATPKPGVSNIWDVRYPTFETAENGSHAMPTGRQADRDNEEDEVEEYEERVSAASILASQLLATTHALRRIADGTYGICKTCRTPIPLERIRANPAAEYDIEHEPNSMNK